MIARSFLYLLLAATGTLWAQVPSVTVDTSYQTSAVHEHFPVFYEAMKSRMDFPLSWHTGDFDNFRTWQDSARKTFFKLLGPPPPLRPFDPLVIAEQDRGSYVAKKVVFNVTSDSRVLAYLLVPKGKGPFPAVYLLHDHGAKFDIGKEKVIQPFGVAEQRLKSAEAYIDKMYGGRYIGDELAKRGYVCFATDALNWGDRGGGGYEGQQSLASNLMLMGTSFAGLMAWEDLNGLNFFSGLEEVDTTKICAMGLSMGSYRTWRLAGLTDKISAGVAICWMSTIKNLLQKGINITGGNSAYSMLHPGMYNLFDYPDVASMACPKPMLFYNGLQDKLFPIPSVEAAYRQMQKVWKSQHAGHHIETRLWDVPHQFNAQMQDEAFQWLDEKMR